jgi:antitoxin component of RelBE/YafQ-DinJ toxin-antitoxin module
MAETKIRNLRVDPELWNAAAAIADEKGTDLSKEVRAFLTRYVARNSKASKS